MRLSHLICFAAALGLATARPVDAEDTVPSPLYIVTYFDVAPTSTQQSAGIVREAANASRKEDGNAGFEAFEEIRSEEHTSELQSHLNLVCRLLLEKKQTKTTSKPHRSLLSRPLPSINAVSTAESTNYVRYANYICQS